MPHCILEKALPSASVLRLTYSIHVLILFPEPSLDADPELDSVSVSDDNRPPGLSKGRHEPLVDSLPMTGLKRSGSVSEDW